MKIYDFVQASVWESNASGVTRAQIRTGDPGAVSCTTVPPRSQMFSVKTLNCSETFTAGKLSNINNKACLCAAVTIFL